MTIIISELFDKRYGKVKGILTIYSNNIITFLPICEIRDGKKKNYIRKAKPGTILNDL